VTLTYTIYQIAAKKNFKHLLNFSLLFIISAPSIVYHLYTQTDMMIFARSMQNVTLSPPLIYVILGFGIFFPFAFWGIIKIFKNKNENIYIFLVIWFMGGLLLAYLPDFQFQRRLLQGIQLPMIILAIVPFWPYIKKNLYRVNPNLIFPILLLSTLIIMPTTIYTVSRDINLITNHYPGFFINKSQMQTINYLKNRTYFNNVILTEDMSLANILPANIKTKVFIGHGHETIDLENKRNQMFEFVSQYFSEEGAQKFIKKYNISYIVSKKKLDYSSITLIKTFNEYNIYKINNLNPQFK